jgi:hypothetical protein
MSIAHYIIFHPDHARQLVNVSATALVNGEVSTDWRGVVHVDRVGEGNEDPFVFHRHWLYSYCHATQLRRKKSSGPYVQPGSVLIFASGHSAEEGILSVDTVFVVGAARPWSSKPLRLPKKYCDHFEVRSSPLWERHFKFPFQKIHTAVTHTYEAAMWEEEKSEFSYLPLAAPGKKAYVSFVQLGQQLASKIGEKVHGKYPVLLADSEAETILKQLESVTTIKVLRDLITDVVVETKAKRC